MGINKIDVLFSRPTDNVVCNIFSQFSNNDIQFPLDHNATSLFCFLRFYWVFVFYLTYQYSFSPFLGMVLAV